VLPVPVIAKTVNVEPIDGVVLIKLPKGTLAGKVSAAAKRLHPARRGEERPDRHDRRREQGHDGADDRRQEGQALRRSRASSSTGEFQMDQAKNSPFMS